MLRCAPPHQWWRCLINCHECSNQHPARVQPRSNRHRTPRPPATTLPPPLPPLHPRLPFPRPLPPPFPPGFVYGTLSADGRVRCDAMLSCASRMLPPAAPHTPPPPPSGRPTWSSKRSCSAASAAAYSRMSRGSPAAEQPSQPRTSLRRPRKWLGRTQRRQSHQALMVGSPASRQAACNLRQLPRNHASPGTGASAPTSTHCRHSAGEASGCSDGSEATVWVEWHPSGCRPPARVGCWATTVLRGSSFDTHASSASPGRAHTCTVAPSSIDRIWPAQPLAPSPCGAKSATLRPPLPPGWLYATCTTVGNELLREGQSGFTARHRLSSPSPPATPP